LRKLLALLAVIVVVFSGVLGMSGCKDEGDKDVDIEKNKEIQNKLISYRQPLNTDKDQKFDYRLNEDTSVEEDFKNFWSKFSMGDYDGATKFLDSSISDDWKNNNKETYRKIMENAEANFLGEYRIEEYNGTEGNYARVKIELIMPSLEKFYPNFMIQGVDILKTEAKNREGDLKFQEKQELLREKIAPQLDQLADKSEKTRITTENVILLKEDLDEDWIIKEADFIQIDFPNFIEKVIKLENNIDGILEANFDDNDRMIRQLKERTELDLEKVIEDGTPSLKTSIKYPDMNRFYPFFLSECLDIFESIRRDADEDLVRRYINTAYINVLNDDNLSIGKENFTSESGLKFNGDKFRFEIKGSPFIEINDFDYMEEGLELYDFFSYIDGHKFYFDYFLSDKNVEIRKEIFKLKDEVKTIDDDDSFKLTLSYPDPGFIRAMHLKHFDFKTEFNEEEFTEILNFLFEKVYEAKNEGEDVIINEEIKRSIKLSDDHEYILDYNDSYPEVELLFSNS